MADEPIDAATAKNVLTPGALPKELFFLTLQWLDVASVACLALCSKSLRAAVCEKFPAAQRKLRVSDFVRDPKLLAVGLATFEFPCVSLTAWAIRVGSVPTLDYLWRIGFLDAKNVCSAAVKEKNLAVLEWSLAPDVHRYWTPGDCEAAVSSAVLGSDAELLSWVAINGCPCSERSLAEFGSFDHFGNKTAFSVAVRAARATLAMRCPALPPRQSPRFTRPILECRPIEGNLRRSPSGGRRPPHRPEQRPLAHED
jgi:hypothetical protein